MLFKKRLDIQDFAIVLVAAHESFFSEQALVRLSDQLTLVIDPARMPLAKLEWTIFGIYAVVKGIEGNIEDATLRYCASIAFLARMRPQVESESSLTNQEQDAVSLTNKRMEEYNSAWHEFPDSRAVQTLGEAMSQRVLSVTMRDNLLTIPFGQLAVSAMIDTAKFVKDVLSTVKLRL